MRPSDVDQGLKFAQVLLANVGDLFVAFIRESAFNVGLSVWYLMAVLCAHGPKVRR